MKEKDRKQQAKDWEEHYYSNTGKDVILSNIPVLTILQCRAIEDAVLKRWEGRRKFQGWKKECKQTRKLQTEFLLGMVAVTDLLTNAEETNQSSMSPKVMFSIMRGDYIE